MKLEQRVSAGDLLPPGDISVAQMLLVVRLGRGEGAPVPWGWSERVRWAVFFGGPFRSCWWVGGGVRKEAWAVTPRVWSES